MKKLLAIILTILMIVTMIPFTPVAFAAEGDTRTIYVHWDFGRHMGSFQTMFFDSMGNELPYEFESIEDNFDLYRISVDAASYWFDFSNDGIHEGAIPEKVDYYEAATKTWYCSHNMNTSGKQTCKGFLCEICGVNYGEADPDAHDWSNCDGICVNGCGAECAHADQTGSACEICGATLHTCDFTGEWKHDSENHWKECTCGAKEQIASHENTLVQAEAKAPTCSAAGYEAYEYCTACDYTTYEEIPKEIFHKDADKNNKCDDCSAELAFEINRNGELLYYDNPYIQGFQALYDAAQDGDVITLLRDVFASDIELRKELTYDLNGFNIITVSNRKIYIHDNVTFKDSVGGSKIYLEVFVYSPCSFEGCSYYILSIEEAGITLDSILSPCAGYYDYKGNAIDTTGKKSITDIYVIENHTEGDIYNCLGYKCAVCEKYYGEPNPDGHEYTEGVCDACGYECLHTWAGLYGVCAVCGYECPHESTQKDIFRPAQNKDGTWINGVLIATCDACGHSTVVQEVKRDHEGYKVFDETAAKIEAILNSGVMVENMNEYYTRVLNNMKNIAYEKVYTDYEGAVPSMTEGLNRILAEIEAGLADGTMKKADWTYMTALLEEVNTLIDNDANNIVPKVIGYYYSPRGFYNGDVNNPNYSQAAYNEAIANYDLENMLETLIAGLKDGTMLKADYTEIDEAIAALDEKLADVNLTDEAKAEIEDIKAQLEEMKKDPLSSKADVEELMKAVEELEAGIEDGSAVKVNGISELNKYIISIEKEIIEKYGVEEYQRMSDSLSDDIKAEIMDIINEAEGIEGSVKDNEEKLNELKARLEVIYAKIENCLSGTHNGLKYEVTEEAKCGKNAVESATCTLCGEVLTKEVENSALTHSFTEYVYNEDATCEADGTKTAVCANGCRETDTVTAEGTKLDHADEDGDGICDDCETEINDVCPDCGKDAHTSELEELICVLTIIIKIIVEFIAKMSA